MAHLPSGLTLTLLNLPPWRGLPWMVCLKQPLPITSIAPPSVMWKHFVHSLIFDGATPWELLKNRNIVCLVLCIFQYLDQNLVHARCS